LMTEMIMSASPSWRAAAWRLPFGARRDEHNTIRYVNKQEAINTCLSFRGERFARTTPGHDAADFPEDRESFG